MKRAMLVILVLAMIISMIPTATITAEASVADDIVSIARGQIGPYGSDNNKFTLWFYGKTTSAAWCAIFVSWCANQVGVLGNVIPKQANCASMLAWFNNRGEYHSVSSGYVPQKGDIVFFDTDGSGVTHHVEIVAQSGFITENGKTKVRCIGGNTSNSSFNGSDYVAEKNRYIYQSECKVMGYAHPSYGGSADYNNYTYTFTFDANGGTLGSTGTFSTSYGKQFQILNTTCTRSGYDWAGWHVKRNNDNKWYVDGQGWCTESQINSNGYMKKVYANYSTMTLDDSWTDGIMGDCAYTFYAIWLQSRDTYIRVFTSPYGEGCDHLTALNNATGTGFARNSVYVWYMMYDIHTGDLFNSYQNSTYSVELAVYDTEGNPYTPYSYDNCDANWIYFTPQRSGTYSVQASVTMNGKVVATTASTYEVSYDAELISSMSSVSLHLNGTNSQTVTLTTGGALPGQYNIRRTAMVNSNVSTSWGSWDGNSIPLTITGKTVGQTDVTIEIYEKYTGNEETVARIVIPVTVIGSLSLNSTTSTSVTTGGEVKYYTYTPSTSGNYVIYSTGDSDTKVCLYNSSGTELANNDDGGDNQNFRLAYNMTAGTTYKFAVQYYNSSTTGTIPFTFGQVYTVTYHVNGGGGAPFSQIKDYGKTLTLSSDVPTRSGYTFLGWSTSSTATSATYQPGGSFTSNANTTLYAVWKANPTALSLNSTYIADITTAGEMKYYSYTPSTSGNYVIYSFNGGDKKVYLYSASGSEIIHDDDSGDGYNFRLVYNMTAGTTYIFGVKFYDSTLGALPFTFGQVYTVTYDANGGSGAPDSQTKDYAKNLTLSSGAPTRTGYTFLGWSTSSTATSATYQPGDSLFTNANTTLYAVWKANPTALSLNSSSSASITTAGEVKYYTYTPGTSGNYVIYSTGDRDTKVYLYDASGNQLTSNDDGGDNQNFRLAYNMTAGTTYKFGVQYYSSSSTGTITFTFGQVYTVTYDANGGSGAPDSQTKDYGKPLTLSSDVPTRSGYTFLGWSTSSTATSASYQAGGSFATNANTTLYAVWKANEYTISFHANDGSVSPSNITVTYGGTYGILPTPTRSGYTFTGWYMSLTGGSRVTGNTTVTTAYDHTLYAQWTRDMYSLTYNSNGGIGGNLTCLGATEYTIQSEVPVRDGYTFLGWSKSRNATSATYIAGNSITLTSDTTLYAVWKAIEYTIRYAANGGSGAPSNQTKYHGTTLTLSSTKPTRTGYTFQGWATSSTATSASYQPGGTFTTNADTTLYAVWQANTYAVRYNANGGSGSMSNSTHTYDASKALSSNGFLRSGYTFLGWATSSSATSASYTNCQSVMNLTSTNGATVDLYAVWSKIPTYTISYNANGGSGAPADQTKTKDVNLTLSSNVPTRTGYAFLGWATSSTAPSATYQTGDTFTTNADTTLYAVWEAVISAVLLGDVNGDGVVDAGDAVLISRYDAGFVALTPEQLKVGDVNKDGTVDAGDAVVISRYDAGFVDNLE